MLAPTSLSLYYGNNNSGCALRPKKKLSNTRRLNCAYDPNTRRANKASTTLQFHPVPSVSCAAYGSPKTRLWLVMPGTSTWYVGMHTVFRVLVDRADALTCRLRPHFFGKCGDIKHVSFFTPHFLCAGWWVSAHFVPVGRDVSVSWGQGIVAVIDVNTFQVEGAFRRSDSGILV